MLQQLTECSWSLRDAFCALDRDGNGVIPSSELRTRLRDLGIELTFDETRRILKKVDTDNDGQVSFSVSPRALRPPRRPLQRRALREARKAHKERKETLRDVLGMLKSSRNPQVEYLARVMKKWARENGGWGAAARKSRHLKHGSSSMK